MILKNEIAGEMGEFVAEALSLKELHMPPELATVVQGLYDRGLYKEAKRKICEYAAQLENQTEKIRYKNFLNFKEVIKRKSSHIIMTHAYLLQMSAEQLAGYDIIIDEDILATMLRNTYSVSVKNVKKAMEAGMITGKLTGQMEQVINLRDDLYLKSSVLTKDYISQEVQAQLQIDGNVNGLFGAGSYYLAGDMIEYFVPQKFPFQKVIILSATLNEAVYRLFLVEGM